MQISLNMLKYLWLTLVILFVPIIVNAQFNGSMLNEYQYGNIPSDESGDFNSIYTRALLDYQYKDFRLSTGLQLYQTPYEDRNYVNLSSAQLNYQTEKISVNVGNYQEVLGKGLLLRNYQIPNAVIEDLGFRSKQYFYTDILGASATLQLKNMTLKALWGYSLNNLYPPTESWEQRRYDELAGAETHFNIRDQRIGASFLSVNNELEESYYGMLHSGGSFLNYFSYYVGYASYLGGSGKDDLKGDSYAAYGSLNAYINSFGLSLEYKNYKNFLLGAGVNEPPALVKEHSYKLLNRSTHVLQPTNETGIQLEVFYNVNLFSTITANYTLANNDFGEDLTYQEWFLEYSGSVFSNTDLKVFVDFAQDPFKGEEDRISIGSSIDQSLGTNFGVVFDIEGQDFTRYEESVNNFYSGLTFRYQSKLFLGLQGEYSTDSFVTEDSKYWIGGNIQYKPHNKHTFNVFVGERRGGPACSAGICYEVLDFRGVEVRWAARL